MLHFAPSNSYSTHVMNPHRPSLILVILYVAIVVALDEFKISGYIPDYRFYINLNNTAPFLTDLILFSVDPFMRCCLHKDQYTIARKARAFKEENEGSLNLWLSVGGGGRSDGFLDNLDSLTTRIMRTVSEENLNGVDLDCESFASQEDYLKYLNWIRDVVPVVHEHGIQISVALHAGQFMYPDIYKIVDRIHLMTYDMPGEYHASMGSVQSAVEKLIVSGCPADKVHIGIPAYARHVQQPGNVKTFAELVDSMSPQMDLDGLNSWNGFRGDSPKDAWAKVTYAKAHGLGGVFVWEIGQDKQTAEASGGILLEALSGRTYEKASSDEL